MAATATTTTGERRTIARLRNDPACFFEEVTGAKPWPKQIAIAESVRDHRITAVSSCHGSGKTWTAGRIVLWFGTTHCPCIIITTAPTQRQVRDQLWKEIRTGHRDAREQGAPLGGRMLTQDWRIDEDWYALGFTTSEYDPEKFAGFHSERILVVVDEASGISEQIYTASDGLMTSAGARRLEIGNPTDPKSRFAESFARERVSKHFIAAWDTPNFTRFGIGREDMLSGNWPEKVAGAAYPYPALVTPEWVAEKLEDWGPTHPLWVSRVEGRFPEDATDALIRSAWLDAAADSEIQPGGEDPIELAVDVGLGVAETVIGQRQGPCASIFDAFHEPDTMKATGRVIDAYRRTGAKRIKVDSVGPGRGVYDRLHEQGLPVVAMEAGAKPENDERFPNRRCEWWGTFANRLERFEVALDIDDKTRGQLLDVKRTFDSRGRLVVETKDQMRARGVKSPDRGDTVVMLFGEGSSIVTDIEFSQESRPSAWRL